MAARKIPDLDMANLINFAEKPINLTIGGEDMVLTQQEALLQAMYQSAMKGRVTTQRYLFEKMAEAFLDLAFVQSRYEEYSEALAKDPDSVPDEVKRVVRMMESSTGRPRSKIRMTTPPTRKRRRS